MTDKIIETVLIATIFWIDTIFCIFLSFCYNILTFPQIVLIIGNTNILSSIKSILLKEMKQQE